MHPDENLLNYHTFEGTDDNWTACISPEPWPQSYQIIAGEHDYGLINNYKDFYYRTAPSWIKDRMTQAGVEEAHNVGPGTWERSIILATQLLCSGGQFMPAVRVEGNKIYINWQHGINTTCQP